MHADPPFVLLEDRLDRSASARLYIHPQDVIRCEDPAEVGAALARLEKEVGNGLHAAGFLAYELGYVLEPRLRKLVPARRTDSLIWMGLFTAPLRLAGGEADAFFAGLPPPWPLIGIEAGHGHGTHVAKVQSLLELIRAGDVYQANLTFPLRFRYDGHPLSLYAALRSRQPTAHAAVVATGDAWVLSASPELFLHVDGPEVESRPMKGTAARGINTAMDESALCALVADPKQRAENLMITDLIRNDLGRICEIGSVRVPRLFTPETHPTFHALTSTVTGRLRPGLGLNELLAATFPCGSIVGAPKIRAAEVLAELEDGPRGVYTGAIGAFGPDGSVTLNVAIRTAVLRLDGTGTYGVGGGVVADSDPEAEYDEARLKGRVLEDLADDFGLIETLRWSTTSGFVRLARHLDRLEASAAALGFAFDRTAAQGELVCSARNWENLGEDRRVRVLLRRAGAVMVEAFAAPTADDGVPAVGFTSIRLDAGDPFLKHKTTCRVKYDLAAAEAEAAGWADGLILNRSGEVADGSRHTVFVDIGGRLVTPPLASGALPGVLRGELIEANRVVEAMLTQDDVRGASQLFIGNSLRGLRRARLAALGPEPTRPHAHRFYS